jgi:lipopolysaccharide assembly protein A
MLFIILLLVIGSVLVYLSQFNFIPVSVNLGWHIFADIPLFYVIVGSMLLGLILAYAAYLGNAITNSMILSGKNKEIKKDRNEVLELTKRIHQLELENEKLKHSPRVELEDPNSL